MSLGLIGQKIGMTRIFTENGNSLPVTVIDVSNNRVTQLKNIDTDGYTAVQLAYGKKKTNRLNKSIVGHFTKASVEASRILKEFRMNPDDNFNSLSVGMIIKADIFQRMGGGHQELSSKKQTAFCPRFFAAGSLDPRRPP